MASLLDSTGKEITVAKSKVSVDDEFCIGNYDLQITESINADECSMENLFKGSQIEPVHVHKSILSKGRSSKPLSSHLTRTILDKKVLHDPNAGNMWIILIIRSCLCSNKYS